MCPTDRPLQSSAGWAESTSPPPLPAIAAWDDFEAKQPPATAGVDEAGDKGVDEVVLVVLVPAGFEAGDILVLHEESVEGGTVEVEIPPGVEPGDEHPAEEQS